MRILLTGGAGYIGSHTAVVLHQAGHDVVLYDNFCNSQTDVLQKIEKITGRPLVGVYGDIRQTELLAKTIDEHQVTAVVHFAGLKAVGESVGQPLAYYANNVQGTLSLLQAMQYCGIKDLVFSSSATVYGDPQYLPIDENHPTAVTNLYGRTKLQIEEILADVARSDDEWRIFCLRYFNPVGAHDSGLIGDNPSGTPNNLLPFIARVAAGRLPCVDIFGDDYPTPDGTGVRDYIHVMDLAEGHAAALSVLQYRDKAFELLNVGTGRGYSVLDMIRAFAEVTGESVPFRATPRRAGDVAASYANAEKAALVLQWRATRTLTEMCSSAWKFQASSDDPSHCNLERS